MQITKINNFTDLKVWQKSHAMVLRVYEETKNFPSYELFGLTSQLRRAVVSITSNIAEGFSRSTAKDKRHFYSMALGSLTETINQLIIIHDLEYIKAAAYLDLINQTTEIQKMLHGLIKNSTDRF